MLHFLNYLSIFFLIIGSFFIFSSIVGLTRYKDFYIKLHTLNMFNIYGMSFILLSIGILSYKPVIFIEILFFIVINCICSITVVNILLKNAILNNIPYKAKTRDDIIQEENEELENKDKIFIDNSKISKESLRKKLNYSEKIKLEKLKEKERKKQEKLKEKEQKKQEKLREKEQKKQEKLKEKEQKKVSTKKQQDKKPQTQPQQKPQQQTQPKQQQTQQQQQQTQPQTQNKEQQKPKEEMSDIEKENEELKQKIKEQKRILRKKIETVRKNAFITRKPEEIQKAEDLIKGILDKYHLTEEMLADDYEDDF